ncbi:hypothetical protein NDU88_010495 [Pleurodeles waltl]|uniref:Uncharacterized protein n=1 Tax=Pleurodeles waltl TaxID=8319 RepID=A0AAV7R0H6_PLEWA|nr:hypothetical protein NDU88_010495 [Pleurodeles waltl]
MVDEQRGWERRGTELRTELLALWFLARRLTDAPECWESLEAPRRTDVIDRSALSGEPKSDKDCCGGRAVVRRSSHPGEMRPVAAQYLNLDWHSICILIPPTSTTVLDNLPARLLVMRRGVAWCQRQDC